MKNVQRKIQKISLTGMSNNVQKKWVHGMETIFKRLSIKTQKWLFFLVFAGIATYCFSLLLGSGSGGLPYIGKIKQVRLPDLEVNDFGESAPEMKIKRLRQYLDSLSAAPDGSREKDSFYSRHPGIMDSIQKWELQLKTLRNK